MAAKRHERTRARRSALQVLYTGEITGDSPIDVAEQGRTIDENGPVPDYALDLVRGIGEHRDAIDEYLIATSENWSLSRMPIVDRSILRLATYEMMYVDDVPPSVTINEAVELAKDFGGEDESPRFVNGVLGRIAKRLEDEAGAGEAAEPSGVAEPVEAAAPAAAAESAGAVPDAAAPAAAAESAVAGEAEGVHGA